MPMPSATNSASVDRPAAAASTAARPVIQLDDVTVGWNGVPALSGVTGTFVEGSLTAILGPNGAGKSTLLKTVTGQLTARTGRVTIHDPFRGGISLLPQISEIDRSFPITTYDLVSMGAWRRVGAFRRYDKGERQRIHDALATVGLTDKSRDLISNLSGGQMQRALFARLIVCNAPVMILDEPFTAVDEGTCDLLLQILLDWHRQGRTVLVVLHDAALVRQCFPQTLLLARQVVAWGDTARVLTEANLDRARSLALGGF